jgi:uncharacterized protein
MTQAIDSTMVLQRYVSAVQAGHREAVRELFTEDATWRLDAGKLPISGTWEGRDTIIDEFLATAMSHYEPGSVNLEITAMIVDRDQVVLQWTSRARMPDGRPYENDCIGVFTVRDGQIQAVREYMDTLYAHEVVFSDR